jgi:hypothetical protein
MKRLNHRLVYIFIAIFALGSLPLSAQRVRSTTKDELPAFSRIVLGGEFSLDIRYGKQYRARMAVEELFGDYVQFSVADSTLTVTMDERKVPGEVRKLFKGKDSRSPEFRIEVTMPETLRELALDGRAALVAADDLVFDDSCVSVKLSDNARIASVAFKANRIRLSLDRKADATLSVDCDSLSVDQAGSSNLDLTHRTAASAFAVSGNATLLVRGETGLLKLDAKGFSEAILNGKAPVARYRIGTSSQVNAVSLDNARAFAEVAGLNSSLTTAATDELTVDLGTCASVYFLNDPTLHVLYLKNASLIPYDRK